MSTDDQREASPETQVRESMALVEALGFIVPQDHVLGTDWHSLSVWESPPMERLKELIRSDAIGAIVMGDAPRGAGTSRKVARMRPLGVVKG